MLKLKPFGVGVELEKVGTTRAVRPAVNEVALTVLDPESKPFLVAVIVTVEKVFGAKPETVTTPEVLTATIPLFVAVPSQL